MRHKKRERIDELEFRVELLEKRNKQLRLYAPQHYYGGLVPEQPGQKTPLERGWGEFWASIARGLRSGKKQ